MLRWYSILAKVLLITAPSLYTFICANQIKKGEQAREDKKMINIDILFICEEGLQIGNNREVQRGATFVVADCPIKSRR